METPVIVALVSSLSAVLVALLGLWFNRRKSGAEGGMAELTLQMKEISEPMALVKSLQAELAEQIELNTQLRKDYAALEGRVGAQEIKLARLEPALIRVRELEELVEHLEQENAALQKEIEALRDRVSRQEESSGEVPIKVDD